jgi:hypothetical protein
MTKPLYSRPHQLEPLPGKQCGSEKLAIDGKGRVNLSASLLRCICNPFKVAETGENR